jgi:hypothetical protein
MEKSGSETLLLSITILRHTLEYHLTTNAFFYANVTGNVFENNALGVKHKIQYF